MSWQFEFVAPSKVAATAAIQAQPHVPATVAAGLVSTVAAFPEVPAGHAILVASTGGISSNDVTYAYGIAKAEVRLVLVAPATPTTP